jgi:threonine dehydrogenase-like Zn-dependent dehydrogenase
MSPAASAAMAAGDFHYYFCQNMADYGNNLFAADRQRLFGGWSQIHLHHSGSFLVRVSDDLPSEVAVITGIMALTVGLDRAKQTSVFPSAGLAFDDTVVVLGVGPLGMCALALITAVRDSTIRPLADMDGYRTVN